MEQDNTQAPLSEEQLQQIRRDIGMLQWRDAHERESKVAADYALEIITTLLAEVERARAREAAMLPIVQAVAEADNSDNSVCYQICNYRMEDGWRADYKPVLAHDSPCYVEKARAILAESEG